MDQDREAKVGVAPYSDGSGYRATVRAYTENGEPMFEVAVTYRLEAKYWPELRQAIDDALVLVSKHPIALSPPTQEQEG